VPPRVEFSARRVGDDWEITCRDNGIGIEPEYADKIFVIFQRLHHRDAYPGTGIGLAIAQRIVEHHGGRIWADASSADGATIRFTLPAMTAEPQVAAHDEPAAPADQEVVATTPHPG
jgi:light-regulated signal transduction histidine kinase (bacteriophytochrome)